MISKYANGTGVEPMYVHIGRKIRRARERCGLTQGELAASIKPPLTRAALAGMEAGRQRIMLHVLLDIATACDTTVGRMLPTPAHLTRMAATERVP